MDGPDEQFRFFFGVVRGESDPDPAADPVYADPVGERFRVIVPIGGKDAVEFPAYVSGLPSFQGKGDGGGLGAFGLYSFRPGTSASPCRMMSARPFSCRSMRSKPETRRSRRVEPVPSPAMKSTAGTMDAMASWLCVPVSSLPGAVEGAGCRR